MNRKDTKVESKSVLWDKSDPSLSLTEENKIKTSLKFSCKVLEKKFKKVKKKKIIIYEILFLMTFLLIPLLS